MLFLVLYQGVPDSLREWLSEAKLAVNRLSPAMLSILRRFLALKARKGFVVNANLCIPRGCVVVYL